MRNAAAHNDFDLDFEDVDADVGRQTGLRRVLGRNPGARIGAAGLVALSLAIVVNALLLQDQRHAAPLFQLNLRSQNSAALEEQAAPPLPAPRPLEMTVLPPAKPIPALRVDAPRADAGRADPIGREIARLDQPQTRVEKSKPAETRPADAKHADAIGGLIRNAGVSPMQANEPDTGVMSAQRALMRLGFVLRPDGVFGGTTRQAIERFERDNRMPVRGELTSRVKAELARQSGVGIE